MFLPLRPAKSAMRSMYFSFENEPLPLQLVTMRIRFVHCAISTFGNEHAYLYLACKESVVSMVSSA